MPNTAIVTSKINSNSDVRIAKIEARSQETSRYIELIEKMLDNPIVELTAWCLLFNWIMTHLPNDTAVKIMEELGAPLVFTAGVGCIGAKQIAPAMPLLASGLSSLGTIAKVVGA